MADPLTPAVSDRICKHMNEDHADAIALYAKHFGAVESSTGAILERIDAEGMDILVQQQDQAQTIRIPFERPLADSEEAHQVLIAMVKQARAAS
ncbi:DUF2470 domain-containing protein [Lyngbya confervoides]|uniref:DUF2470 domain-containing protein n=1 Tax=Lyngbya confervoides BDU141951 TaxID=1574623 RepID=A0ABD4T3E1_9CYAN|nr:DUF2470 domain-containing protein [Lyngbya confervoides]MCM1982767.1 DUF2470 domain-containing protein [Lyngbya confervoides BDU141951]